MGVRYKCIVMCWHEQLNCWLIKPAQCIATMGVQCRRIVKLPADAIAGTKHVVGVVPLNIDADDAKDNTDSLLLRFSDDQQVSTVHSMRCRAQLMLFQHC